MSALEVVDVSVSELAAMFSPYNPRKIDDHDMAALRRSLRFFGAVLGWIVADGEGCSR